jgi:flagellar motor component MotA
VHCTLAGILCTSVVEEPVVLHLKGRRESSLLPTDVFSETLVVYLSAQLHDFTSQKAIILTESLLMEMQLGT